MPTRAWLWLLGLTLIGAAAASARADSAGRLYKVAVIGDADERLRGSYAEQRVALGERAATHLGRALRIWFPHPGSLVVTGTPVCFPDVVVTVAHVYLNIGDGTAKPLGLRISVPDLHRPGEFRDTIPVTDYRLSNLGRRYNPNQAPRVRDDFLVLRLQQPLPPDLVPLALPPYDKLVKNRPPRCEGPTVNAAYHADLGLLNDTTIAAAASAADGDRFSARGAVPLLTLSSRLTAKAADGSHYGRWYHDPYVVFPEHDTHESASGSALVCPARDDTGQRRDYLYGLMVGQLFLDNTGAGSRYRPAINVATTNLVGIQRAIAALKNLPVETLDQHCQTALRGF